MKKYCLILLVILNTTIYASEVIPAGNFFGTGSFSCFFINSRIQRPLSAHWQIKKLSEDSSQFEMIGNY